MKCIFQFSSAWQPACCCCQCGLHKLARDHISSWTSTPLTHLPVTGGIWQLLLSHWRT